MPKMETMPVNTIQDELKRLPEWHFENNAIVRTVTFPKYLRGIEFVNAVAHLAERQNHHPDIEVHYTKVTLRYWTHVADGVTSLDFDGAKEAETLIGQFQKLPQPKHA
jgi:4a-hydroxytetrahydrobiopterin dehydratase